MVPKPSVPAVEEDEGGMMFWDYEEDPPASAPAAPAAPPPSPPKPIQSSADDFPALPMGAKPKAAPPLNYVTRVQPQGSKYKGPSDREYPSLGGMGGKKAAQSNGAAQQQPQQQPKSTTAFGTAAPSAAFEGWCKERLRGINGSEDITLIYFLCSLSSTKEVQEYPYVTPISPRFHPDFTPNLPLFYLHEGPRVR